jgi:hypothetical protein
MTNYKGFVIEESLENKDVLKKVKILSTKVEKVVEKHKTPWLSQWTLHDVEIAEAEARRPLPKKSANRLTAIMAARGMPISKMILTIILFFATRFFT